MNKGLGFSASFILDSLMSYPIRPIRQTVSNASWAASIFLLLRLDLDVFTDSGGNGLHGGHLQHPGKGADHGGINYGMGPCSQLVI